MVVHPEFVGTWRGAHSTLTIDANGTAEYEQRAAGKLDRVRGRIVSWEGEVLVISSPLPLKTSLRVSTSPSRSGGERKIRVEGAELTYEGPPGRVAQRRPPRPQPG